MNHIESQKKKIQKNNHKILKQKYEKIIKSGTNIKKQIKRYENATIQTKEEKQYFNFYFKKQLKKEFEEWKYLIILEKYNLNSGDKSNNNKNIKNEFLSQFESSINIEELEKKVLKITREKTKIKKRISNYVNVGTTIAALIPIFTPCALGVKTIVSCGSATDSILDETEWYRDQKDKIKQNYKTIKNKIKYCDISNRKNAKHKQEKFEILNEKLKYCDIYNYHIPRPKLIQKENKKWTMNI